MSSTLPPRSKYVVLSGKSQIYETQIIKLLSNSHLFSLHPENTFTLPSPTPIPSEYEIRTEVPSVETYLDLRVKSGMSPKTQACAEIGLKNGLYSCVVVHTATNQIIGMGRLVGDGGKFFNLYVHRWGRVIIEWKHGIIELFDSPFPFFLLLLQQIFLIQRMLRKYRRHRSTARASKERSGESNHGQSDEVDCGKRSRFRLCSFVC